MEIATMKCTLVACGLSVALCSTVFAQTATTETARDTAQQERIEQGLQSGQLSTREAAGLERQQQRIDRTEARDLRDGSLSPAKAAQIQREQNHASADIDRAKHNAVGGNPASASSQRMQADVQRNADQQARINQGVRSGALTGHETASLERGQAHVDRKEAAAGADGRVGAAGQTRIQRSEDRQSGRIARKKRNARAGD